VIYILYINEELKIFNCSLQTKQLPADWKKCKYHSNIQER